VSFCTECHTRYILLRTILSELGNCTKCFLPFCMSVTLGTYIYNITECFSNPECQQKKSSGQFYIFVPSVSLVRSLSTKTLRIVFIECFSTEADTWHSSLLPSNLCNNTTYILSVLLSLSVPKTVSTNPIHQVFCPYRIFWECVPRGHMPSVFSMYQVFLALGTLTCSEK
jgi:hypothetical protein